MESTTAQRIGVRELLEAGVHFGHQAKRWNPKMKRYIFAERAGVHIIDLDQTIQLLRKAQDFIRGVSEAGREVLFVGTKKQAQLTLAEQAMRCGQPYVAERYIGGMLTNFRTIRPRIEYFRGLLEKVEQTPEEERTGRDWFALYREFQNLRRNFAGIINMERLPGALFVVDPKREELLIKEANRLEIPVVALTDTNCDPDVVDYIIPGNDDAIRSINLIAKIVSDAVLEGRGESAVESEDLPVPPVVEEAQISRDVAEGSGDPAESGNGAQTASAESSGAALAAESAGEATAEPGAEVRGPQADSEPETSSEEPATPAASSVEGEEVAAAPRIEDELQAEPEEAAGEEAGPEAEPDTGESAEKEES